MMRRCFLRRTTAVASVVSLAEECIAAGLFHDALRHLNGAKQSSHAAIGRTFGGSSGGGGAMPNNHPHGPQQTESFVDYLRALCFLRLKDPLHARQALIEELRHNEANEDARDLLHRVDASLEAAFALPPAVAEAEPLFAMIYSGIRGHSMLHWPRLYSLFSHTRELCEENVPGDLVECGVAGGGSAVLMAVVAKHFSRTPRRVFACDTFCGMPEPTGADSIDNGRVAATETYWGTGTCSASERWVRNLASTYDVQLETVPGLFEHTLPTLVNNGTVKDVALLHLDSDWYSSTRTCLELLYPRVHRGGVMQIDDFNYWDGCRQAVEEYFESHHVSLQRLQTIDGNAVWFRK